MAPEVHSSQKTPIFGLVTKGRRRRRAVRPDREAAGRKGAQIRDSVAANPRDDLRESATVVAGSHLGTGIVPAMSPPGDARGLLPRFAQELVEQTLADTPITVIQGARQVGKSTLARHVLAGRNVPSVGKGRGPTGQEPSARLGKGCSPT
jgi:hypothetical protein